MRVVGTPWYFHLATSFTDIAADVGQLKQREPRLNEAQCCRCTATVADDVTVRGVEIYFHEGVAVKTHFHICAAAKGTVHEPMADP